MLRSTRIRGFSLVEVVVAVGIFAVAVVVILALLPSFIREGTDSADALIAQRLTDAVYIELERVAAVGGFDALASAVPVMDSSLHDGFVMVATRDGARLHALTFAPPDASAMIPDTDRYFIVEAWRFGSGALAFDPSGAVLPLLVRVSWPYRIAGASDSTPISQRAQFMFLVSLNR
jgi:prepilin-type N-terminal cleavage/methylation domain-containing protein